MRRTLLAALIALPLCAAEQASAESPYLNSCDAEGDPGTCLHLARLYQEGVMGFPKDDTRAERLREAGLTGLRAACAEGDSAGCRDLTNYGRFARDLETSEAMGFIAEGIAGMEAACLSGDPRACFDRAGLGDGVPPEALLPGAASMSREELRAGIEADKAAWDARMPAATDIALSRAQAACEAGDRLACVKALRTKRLFVEADAEDYLLLTPLLELCEDEVNTACAVYYSAASYVTSGNKHPDLKAEGLARLEAACASGNGAACYTRSRFFTFVERDAAKPYLDAGCAADNPRACHSLATIAYAAWQKAPKPAADLLATASDRLTKSCDLGDVVDCHMLEHLSGH